MNQLNSEALKQHYDAVKPILRNRMMEVRDNPRIFSQQEKDRIVADVREELVQQFENVPPDQSCSASFLK